MRFFLRVCCEENSSCLSLNKRATKSSVVLWVLRNGKKLPPKGKCTMKCPLICIFELLTFGARVQLEPDHKSTRFPFRKRRTLRRERIEYTHTNHETEWLLLANALTPREHILDLYTLLNMLPACSFPGYHRTGPAREVPLRKDIIRDVCQALIALHLWQIEADTLRGGMGT